MAEQTETHARGRVIGIVAAVLRWIGTIIAVILVAHVLLTVFGANPDNPITTFVRSWAPPRALAFTDRDPPAHGKLRVLANYGLAAIFWLVVTSIVVRLVRRLG